MRTFNSRSPLGLASVSQPHCRPLRLSILIISRHVVSYIFKFFLFSSIHRRNRPRCNKWRDPTAEVRFLPPYPTYQLVSKHSPRVTVYILHRSTSSMIIPFLICFISIG